MPSRRPGRIAYSIGFLAAIGFPGSVFVIVAVIKFWPVAVSLLVIGSVAFLATRGAKPTALAPARATLTSVTVTTPQSADATASLDGPVIRWLNQTAVELSLLGFEAVAPNALGELAGVPIRGTCALTNARTRLTVHVFASAELADGAATTLQTRASTVAAERDGRIAIRVTDRVVVIARVHRGVVDEFELEEILTLIARNTLAPTSGQSI